MTRWTWGWLGGLVVLLGLVLTVPLNGVGCAPRTPGDNCGDAWSMFELVHWTGNSESVLSVYKVVFLIVLVAGALFVVLDVQARRRRKVGKTRSPDHADAGQS